MKKPKTKYCFCFLAELCVESFDSCLNYNIAPSQFSFDSDCGDDDVNMNNSTNVTNSSNVGLNSDDEDYEFATHVIKVRRSGQISGVQSLWELEGTTKITDYSGIQTVKMCPKDE